MSEEADRLYSLPLDQFTAERNELAKRLRAEDRAADAEEVKGLRKPTVAAWALNQLARVRPDRVEALLETVERVRAASSGPELRDTSRDLRTSVTEATEAAVQLLEEAGRPAAAQRERIVSTLQAATSDPDAAELLRRGRLVEDLVPSGFGPAPAAAAGAPAVDPAQAEARAEVEDLTRRLAAAESAADDARRRADDAQAAAELARAQADKEADAAAGAASEVAALKEALERARSVLDLR